MKQQILEVQNYFVQKIQKKEYVLQSAEPEFDGWFKVNLNIDDNFFRLGINNDMLCLYESIIDFTREQKAEIILALQYLAKDFKEKSIQLLKDKIAELESQN